VCSTQQKGDNVIYKSEHSEAVKTAIDEVVKSAGIKSCSALARRLDVSKQALSKWRVTGLVPAHRAMQMELMTNGNVGWKDLCPDIVSDFERCQREETIYESSR